MNKLQTRTKRKYHPKSEKSSTGLIVALLTQYNNKNGIGTALVKNDMKNSCIQIYSFCIILLPIFFKASGL